MRSEETFSVVPLPRRSNVGMLGHEDLRRGARRDARRVDRDEIAPGCSSGETRNALPLCANVE